MLNEKTLIEILKIPNPPTIKNLEWKTQDSTQDSILFYKIIQGQESLFTDRISKAKFGWLITNKIDSNLPPNSTVIDEKLWPAIQKKIADELYPIPPKLKLLGITGTNGKTTTTDLVLQIGHLNSLKGMSIGTLGVREYNTQILDFGLTSPAFIDLRKYLANYGHDKDFCVMEASSHALEQGRLFGIVFDSAGWLSFSQDHLDYHGSMESYFKSKCLIYSHLRKNAKLYVPSEQKDLFDKLFKVSSQTSMASIIGDELPVFFKPRFNRNNLEVALAMIDFVFGNQRQVNYSLLNAPDGRFYIQSFKSNYIVVDFAHTPDALENICRGIRQTFPNHKLKVLFGCGGDRDRSKRPLMAKVVDRWADEIYVTSDNPRSESPSVIIQDILKGIQQKPFQAIVERPTAVRKAFNELKQNEVLLLAGKGHEDYILINGVKHPYSDISEVEEFLSEKKI